MYYTCMYVCTYVHMYTYIQTDRQTVRQTNICICMDGCMYAYIIGIYRGRCYIGCGDG